MSRRSPEFYSNRVMLGFGIVGAVIALTAVAPSCRGAYERAPLPAQTARRGTGSETAHYHAWQALRKGQPFPSRRRGVRMDRPLRARACTRAREIIEEFLPGCMIDSALLSLTLRRLCC